MPTFMAFHAYHFGHSGKLTEPGGHPSLLCELGYCASYFRIKYLSAHIVWLKYICMEFPVSHADVQWNPSKVDNLEPHIVSNRVGCQLYSRNRFLFIT